MEPSYSILLYSKYSPNCKKLFNLIDSVNLEIKIDTFCVDNEKVRNQVKTSQIGVSIVPCILLIFPNGNVEKYEGGHAFSWVENLIPPPQPQPVQQPIPRPIVQQRKAPKIQESEEEEPIEEEPIEELPPRKIKSRPGRVKKGGVSSIDEIPLEDDRHRNLPQPKRVRQGEKSYEEDDNLFSGEPVDNRKEPVNSVKKESSESGSSIMARAKELAMGREETESVINKPKRRP